MRSMGGRLFHTLMIGLMAGSLASAAHADDPKPWSAAGVWNIYKEADDCYVAANLGEDSDIGVLINDQRVIAGLYSVKDQGGVEDGAYNGISWRLASTTSSGKTIISHSNASIVLMTFLNEPFLKKLGNASQLTITNHYVDDETDDEGDETLATINLTDIDGAVSELRRCWKEAIGEDRGSGKPVATAPVLTNSDEIAQYTDYPVEALRNREFGRTVVTLTVSAHGVPSACALKQSSGSVSLDSATCKTFLDHAQFTPAKDANGDATQGAYERAITWNLPK